MNEKYLIRAKEIAELEGVQKTHFLNDNAKRINKSLGDLTGLTGFGFHIIEVLPGHESTEYHKHYHEDECTYVLSGKGNVTIGEKKYEIGAGDFIGYRSGGFAHTMEATGDVALVCIVVGERLAHDVGDYPNKQKRIYRQTGLSWNLVDHDSIQEPKAGEK